MSEAQFTLVDSPDGLAELAARLRRNLERYESRRPVRQVPG